VGLKRLLAAMPKINTINHMACSSPGIFIRVFLFLCISAYSAYSQQSHGIVSRIVYLAGNTADAENTKNLEALRESVLKETAPVTVIYNGDILHKSGLEVNALNADSAFIRLLLAVVKDAPEAAVYFIPGDLDWNNSGMYGWESVIKLEQLVNGIAGKKVFLPESGCPGPVTIDLGEDLLLILISSPWWIHPYERPHAPATNCDVLVEQQFMEQLEDLLEENSEKNILMAGHHPAISNGNYGGRNAIGQHFSPPVIGTFKAAYHQNIGDPKDMAYSAYRSFAGNLKFLLQDQSPFIYASAHDYNLQILEFEDSYQLVSGAIVKKVAAATSRNTIYRSKDQGFIKLTYYQDGKIMADVVELAEGKILGITTKELYQSSCNPDMSGAPLNSRYVPCREKIFPAEHMNSDFADSIGAAVGGAEYKAGLMKKAFLGSLYRSSWTTAIQIPYLNLDTARGGLTAIGKGGGRQTHSLSLQGGDGKSYVFRSVNKDPVKALDPVLRKTFVVGLSRQFTATQHPYGAMPVSYMLDATDILHAQPSLYLLPDDPKLGMFQKEFGGMLGMLEEKPKEGKGNKAGSYGADDVVRSYELFKKLYKDHDNRIDPAAFARARVFDIWIGDWGRHEDNWKWAGFKEGNKTTYFPIPRDRDHAFSRWNGLLPFLASRHWALPNAENFDYRFRDVSSLTWPSRHLDRFLLSSVDKAAWLQYAGELQQLMNDALIDSAVQHFPKTVIPLSGNTIGAKLKSRRTDLPRGIMEYYDLLAKNVDVVGSNNAEYFKITRMENGSVEVSMFDKDKKTNGPSGIPLFHRVFSSEETKSINVYGLDGDDILMMDGNATKTILVRMFGGKGDDLMVNTATGVSRNHITQLYDYETNAHDSITPAREQKVVLSDERNLVEYNRQAFHYNTYLPYPVISYSPEDAFTFGLGLVYTFHQFGEDEYADKFGAGVKVSTEGNFEIKFANELHHAVGNWDWVAAGDIAKPFPYIYYYGSGNETVKFDTVPALYYKSRFNGYNFSTGLQKIFWQKSRFIALAFYENNEGQIPADNILAGDTTVLGNGRINSVGGRLLLDIDFRDDAIVPKRGVRLFAKQSYSYLTNLDDDYTNSEISLELYQTTRTIIPVTLGLKGGATNATGAVPFYKLNTIGRTTGVRGFKRDRFTGNATVYFQSQLTFEFGQVHTGFVPLTLGVFGFFDVGRVWTPDETSNKWHDGYGGGIYFTPLFTFLTTRISYAFSDEERQGLFDLSFGLKF
jgi:hypothetical protein